MIGHTTIVTEERMLHALQECLEVDLPLFVAMLLEEAMVQIDNAVMELTGTGDASEIDVLAWDGTGNRFALWYITIVVRDGTAEQVLEGLLLLVQTVAFNLVLLLKLSTKWNKLLGDHWNQLSGILPVANIVVDLVEECLSTNAEILQVAKTIMTGTIAAVRSVVAILLPWAVGIRLEAWWFVWFRGVVIAAVRSWLRWVWLVWSWLWCCRWLGFV